MTLRKKTGPWRKTLYARYQHTYDKNKNIILRRPQFVTRAVDGLIPRGFTEGDLFFVKSQAKHFKLMLSI